MRVLIIGGTGLTGPHVVRRLVEMGHEITVFHRGQTVADLPPAARHVLGDKNRLADFADRLRDQAPQVVLNMMALTEEDAVSFMQTFRGVAERVVVVSSIDVYRAYGRLHGTEPGPPDSIPLTEDAPLREKLSSEGAAYNKTGVERVVMNDPDLPATVLRYPAVYGPGTQRLFGYVKRMMDQRPFILLDDGITQWRFSHGYAEDVALGAVLAVTNDRAAGRIYNVAERETPPWAEWVREIGEAAGWDGEVISLPMSRLPKHLQHTMDTAQHWVVDTTRIRQELGYDEVVPRGEGLKRSVAWEHENPPAQLQPEVFDYAAEDAAFARLESRGD